MFEKCGFGIENYMFRGGGVLMFIFCILIILLIIFILKRILLGKEKSFKHVKGKSPMEILKRRYDEGEITKKEYQNIKEKIKD